MWAVYAASWVRIPPSPLKQASIGSRLNREAVSLSAQIEVRLAGSADAEAVANLHADSWRRHYRGAYSDAFLDGDVVADRLAVWTDLLRESDPRRFTIVAENGGLVAFANTRFEDDPAWGALLDNLHVADGHKRRGIASRLLAVTAEGRPGSSPETGERAAGEKMQAVDSAT